MTTTNEKTTTIHGSNDDLIAAAKARAKAVGGKIIQGRGHYGRGLAPIGEWIAVVPLDATSSQDDRREIFVRDDR